ncbi:hypothetical protein PanWU01x14_025470, partial [Parasponia andersonii]
MRLVRASFSFFFRVKSSPTTPNFVFLIQGHSYSRDFDRENYSDLVQITPFDL